MPNVIYLKQSDTCVFWLFIGQGSSSLPLTLANFFSYDLYPVFQSLISFHLMFYSFDNTADSAVSFDAKLFPYKFQSTIPQMSYQINTFYVELNISDGWTSDNELQPDSEDARCCHYHYAGQHIPTRIPIRRKKKNAITALCKSLVRDISFRKRLSSTEYELFMK